METAYRVRFLIIRFSSIGDIVLTTPVMRCLKEQMPESEIHYLSKPAFKDLLVSNPYIDKVHLLENSLSQSIKNLKSENFDYIIDLHNNLRTFIIKQRMPVLAFSFNKLNLQKWLLVKLGINRLPKIHIVDRYMDCLKHFDIVNDQKGLDYFIPENDKVSIYTLPEPFRKGFIAFVIGAKHNTKQLPIEKIASIINKIDYPVILLGGKEDTLRAEKLLEITKGEVISLCGVYKLNGSASIIEQSKLVITHDTGLMHIASALKKNILSIWGSTVPEFGMDPYLAGDLSEIIEVKSIKCRPCSKLGYQKCPKKHFNCMNLIDEVALKDKIFRIIAS